MSKKTLFGKSVDVWIDEYSQSHQNRFNLLCHTIGIPMIVLSLVLMLLFFVSIWCFYVGFALFVTGWGLQFIGHAFEGKPPEFFKDWRFLFVGLRWWMRKVSGKASDKK